MSGAANPIPNPNPTPTLNLTLTLTPTPTLTRCGSCALAEPLRTHQEHSVGGLPPPLAAQTTADVSHTTRGSNPGLAQTPEDGPATHAPGTCGGQDPRVSYAKFTRHTLVEGRLVRDNLIATGSGGN